MKLKDLKKGDLFTLKRFIKSEKQIYVRDEYDRSAKKYWIHKYNDWSSFRLVKGDKEIFDDFDIIEDEVPY